MNETQKRIKAYKEVLPGLKERVAGVALLLVMSLVMMTSATFAWLTLSRAPEVTGTATTVTANGNLELALSDTDGEAPEESAVGDSSKNQSALLANLTWGNLVNLSDPGYGLDHLQLRPAMLGDTTDLLNTPLASVNFGQDGRVQEEYNYDLAFTNWNANDQFFEYSPTARYGVRAISTIEYKIQNATFEKYRTLVQTANSQNAAARSAYRAIMGSDKGAKDTPNVKAIAGLMGDYMTAKLNGNKMSELDITSYVDELYSMVNDFSNAYELAGNALAELANIQIFLSKGADAYTSYTFENGDAMWLHDANGNKTALDWATLNGLGIQLTALTQYEKDVQALRDGVDTLNNHYDPETQEVRGAYNAESGTYASKVYWTDIETVVLDLVDIPSCTVAASETEKGTAISGLGKQAAMGLLGKKVYAVIHKGVIKNFEALAGEQINLEGVKVKATYMMTLEMEAASIKTAAFGVTATYQTDRDTYCSFESGGDTSSLLQGSAQDTYGMAIDMWVRTNAADGYLVLEGNVLTETSDPIPATLTLSSGDVVNLYSATITYPKEESGEGESGEDDALGDLLGNKETVDVYRLDPNGTPDDTSDDVWYFADTHGPVYQVETETDDEGNTTTTITDTPTRGESISISSAPKTYTTSTVIGYEGENRVWQENNLLTVNSTTQGNGSCYEFYADNPTDQQNSLKLLSNLRVAFLSSEGAIMAMAKLDTENTYADSGKVTVPLVLTTSANAIYTEEGNLAIAALEQNEATWMTMIVYLEGSELTNDQVLAANEIQGKLNIQFGSSAALNTMGDETLESAEMHVSASVDRNAFDYATDDDMTTNVTVTVDGDEPNSVTAFFMRQVNATQGSREEVMTFAPNGDGTWSASYTFTAPGTYILRSVQLDGQDYDLESRPTVTIAGLDCTVTCGLNAAVLTGDRTYTTGENVLQVSINTDDQDKMPRSVQLQFVNDETGDPVTALMSYNASTNNWTGRATFTASGSYTLTYLILDGDYTELSAAQKKSFYLTLGVSVRVRDRVDNPSLDYDPEGYTLDMLVDIFNEAGDVLANLQNTRLYYGKQGSAIDGLDTDLKWDSGEGCYTGRFLLKKTGIYSFSQVTISGSSITGTTNVPPVYTMLDPDPPAFVSDDTTPYQLMNSGSSAVIKFTMRNTGSAGVIAVVDNTSDDKDPEEIPLGESSVREEELENEEYVYHYTVTLPDDLDTTGVDGVWQLTGLKLYNVYDDNQVFYYGPATEDNGYEEDLYLVWDMTNGSVTDESGAAVTSITTEVQTPKLNIVGMSENFTGGTFMTAYANTNAITITVTDRLGNQLNSQYVTLGEMKTQYNMGDGSDEGYGTKDVVVNGQTVSFGYGGGYSETTADISYSKEFTLDANGGGVYDIDVGEIDLPYAGLYTCHEIVLYISMDGGTNYQTYRYGTGSSDKFTYNFDTYYGNMPVYAVKTESPTVTISAITPTVVNNSGVDETTSGSIDDSSSSEKSGRKTRYYFTTNGSHKTGYKSGINNTATSATVYFLCDHTNSSPYGYTDYYYLASTAWLAALDNKDYHHYTQPTVTLTLAGLDTSKATATMAFADASGTAAMLYENAGGSTKAGFAWPGSTSTPLSDTLYVGIWGDAGDTDNDTKTVAGTVTGSTLVVTYNEKTYTFKVPTITINNPY